MKRLRAVVPIWRLERLWEPLWGRLVRLTWPKYRINDERDNRYIEQIMIHVLRTNSCCVDVGSYAGAVLRQCLRLAPRGRHFAIEPLPHLAEKLRESFPTAEVLNVALSDTAGESPFVHVIGDPGWSGLKRTQSVSGRPIETIMVKTCRLDDVIPHNVTIDFIKIDVEGAELQVLKGASHTIQRCSPCIVFEHGLGAADQYGTTPNAVHDLLTGWGLRIFCIDGSGPLSRDEFVSIYERHAMVNFLAKP
jgi:FkbM family methyltransferase